MISEHINELIGICFLFYAFCLRLARKIEIEIIYVTDANVFVVLLFVIDVGF